VSPLALPVANDLLGFSLSPDGKSFTTSVVDSKSDVWLMEGLE
jgi:hypothetical protein